jgi:tetratricopeptide (TPR) repeat protein
MAQRLTGSALLAGTLVAAWPAVAQDHSGHNGHMMKWGTMPTVSAATPAGADVQLWEGLGPTAFPITTKDATAQLYFNQGLVFAYGFNHWEAQRAFQAAQKRDPDCAMCFWGEALVLGPNINWPMQQEAIAPAWKALKEAERLAPKASVKEQALIAALASRYAADESADRVALDIAYADAMAEVAERFPDDLDVATLAAEAMMDLSPWNYWADGGKTPTGRTTEIVATLERVLKASPDHAGAIHLYIHAVEASDDPKRAEPYADRLAAQKLSTGHLIHMPAHVYFRVGRYVDSLESNKVAAAADEAYLEQVKADGIYPYAYYPHNVHFVLVSAQMAGDAATALDAAGKLDRIVTEQAAREVPLAQPVKAAPLFAHAQFSTPEAVLELPSPADDLPYLKGIWHYARGVAQAGKGDAAAAQAEVDAIAAIVKATDFSGLNGYGVPAGEVLQLARHIVQARIAQAGGDLDKAIAEFESAATIEAALPYMEPAFWYYPVKQSLGAVLLLAGETERAEAAFKASLDAVPNNGWACFGLLETAKRKGDKAAAAALQERLGRTWAGDPALLDLGRM